MTKPTWLPYSKPEFQRVRATVGPLLLDVWPGRASVFAVVGPHNSGCTHETDGDSREEAIAMARDLLRGWLVELDALEAES